MRARNVCDMVGNVARKRRAGDGAAATDREIGWAAYVAGVCRDYRRPRRSGTIEIHGGHRGGSKCVAGACGFRFGSPSARTGRSRRGGRRPFRFGRHRRRRGDELGVASRRRAKGFGRSRIEPLRRRIDREAFGHECRTGIAYFESGFRNREEGVARRGSNRNGSDRSRLHGGTDCWPDQHHAAGLADDRASIRSRDNQYRAPLDRAGLCPRLPG
jgi:hypothetical protein